MNVETIIDATGVQKIGWGVSDAGEPVLMIQVGSQRVKCEMSAQQARDMGCGAIFLSETIRINAQQATPGVATGRG